MTFENHTLATVTRKHRLLYILPILFAMGARADVADSPAPAPAPAQVAVAAAAPAPAQVVPAVAVSAPVHAVSAPSTAEFRNVRGLSPKVLAMALDAVSCARAEGVNGNDDLLTVIDYSLPSTEKRLWVLDLSTGEVLFHELVAHGAGSGDNVPTRFSNVMDSRQTSLGLFLTGGTYQGGNGYSLKLRGLSQGLNDRAEERHIVMHGAWYVNPDHARQHGRIGRSWGCPAVSEASHRQIIDTIKGGSFVFSYSDNDSSFQKASSRTCGASSGTSHAVLAR